MLRLQLSVTCNKKMKKVNYLTYITIILLSLSCNNTEKKESIEIKELLESVIENNNYTLNIYKDANEFLAKTSVTNTQVCNMNLARIDELYKLNNQQDPNFEKLEEILEKFNEDARTDRIIKGFYKDRTNTIKYYTTLRKIIEYGDYLPGTLNEPRLLLPYSINNNKFVANVGDTIKVPIKTFIERDITQWRYELFDTLNFIKTDNDEGYFWIPTYNHQIGTSNQEIPIYSKNIYTNQTDRIGIVEIELTIQEKR